MKKENTKIIHQILHQIFKQKPNAFKHEEINICPSSAEKIYSPLLIIPLKIPPRFLKKSRVWWGEKKNLNYLRDGNDSWSLSNSEEAFSRSGDVYISRLNRVVGRGRKRKKRNEKGFETGFHAGLDLLWADIERVYGSKNLEFPVELSSTRRTFTRTRRRLWSPFSKRLINEVGRLV